MDACQGHGWSYSASEKEKMAYSYGTRDVHVVLFVGRLFTSWICPKNCSLPPAVYRGRGLRTLITFTFPIWGHRMCLASVLDLARIDRGARPKRLKSLDVSVLVRDLVPRIWYYPLYWVVLQATASHLLQPTRIDALFFFSFWGVIVRDASTSHIAAVPQARLIQCLLVSLSNESCSLLENKGRLFTSLFKILRSSRVQSISASSLFLVHFSPPSHHFCPSKHTWSIPGNIAPSRPAPLQSFVDLWCPPPTSNCPELPIIDTTLPTDGEHGIEDKEEKQKTHRFDSLDPNFSSFLP